MCTRYVCASGARANVILFLFTGKNLNHYRYTVYTAQKRGPPAGAESKGHLKW